MIHSLKIVELQCIVRVEHFMLELEYSGSTKSMPWGLSQDKDVILPASSTWESPYLGKTVFTLRWWSGSLRHQDIGSDSIEYAR